MEKSFLNDSKALAAHTDKPALLTNWIETSEEK